MGNRFKTHMRSPEELASERAAREEFGTEALTTFEAELRALCERLEVYVTCDYDGGIWAVHRPTDCERELDASARGMSP